MTASLSVATGRDPVSALGTATEQLQDAGSAQDSRRREILRGRTIGEEFRRSEDVQIAHFDVADVTGDSVTPLQAGFCHSVSNSDIRVWT
ncbi:MAG: hypothetical protein J07HX64_02010 [halophilic archaeon J07HX64]|nr:MAG: hypothetical protein J07HX64_02010 [halophilic archaeon J07HX64]